MELIMEVERRASEIKMSPEELAKTIDHTLLAPYKTTGEFKKLCIEAKTYNFFAVCVNPYWVRFCSDELKGTEIKVAAVVGFPLGQTTSKMKALEARETLENGANEVDMVMNVAAFKDQNHDFVKQDIEAVVEAAEDTPIKVILETGYLTYEEIVKACEISKEAGASFVKTSTGFGPLGAATLHVSLMRTTVGENFGVKAAGGINNFRDVIRMIAAGANRIGASDSVKIIDGYEWARHTNWDIEEIPCRLCPSRMASFAKMPKSVFQYYKMKCADCPFKKFNKFYE